MVIAWHGFQAFLTFSHTHLLIGKCNSLNIYNTLVEDNTLGGNPAR
jgi:hypothetical protein